jgi:cytidylate kinase
MDKRITKILISGKRCTGKTTLLWGLQKKLNWPAFSASQFLRDYIRERGLKGVEIEGRGSHISGEIDGRVQNLLQSDHHVVIDVRAFGGIKGEFPNCMKVLLIAEDRRRFGRSAHREGVEISKAQKRIEKKDAEFIQRAGDIVGFHDFFEPRYYDVVIDTTNLKKDEVVDWVIKKSDTNFY